MSVKKKQKEVEPVAVYIFLLTATVILSSVLRGIYFDIKPFSISYTVILFPAIFYVLILIIRKYGYKEALSGIFISTFSLLIFILLSDFIFQKDMGIITITGLIISSFVSQFIFLVIYYYLFINTKIPWIVLFTNYVFAIVIADIIYLVFSLNRVLSDDFWMVFAIEVGIQSFFGMLFTLLEKNKIRKFLD